VFKKRIFLTFMFAAAFVLAATEAFAQTTVEKTTGWSARMSGARASQDRLPSRQNDADSERRTGEQDFRAPNSGGILDIIEREKEARRRALVGAWKISIPESASGLPPFKAFHTFHYGGTFTEVSDLLPALNETPAHGVWDVDGDKYLLTFELFVFDDKKAPIGIVRVRCSIRLVKADELAAEAVVDFIEPDGTAALDIDRTPFTGKRISPLPLK